MITMAEFKRNIKYLNPPKSKSATDNLGTFDSENADIRFRKRV